MNIGGATMFSRFCLEHILYLGGFDVYKGGEFVLLIFLSWFSPDVDKYGNNPHNTKLNTANIIYYYFYIGSVIGKNTY